MGAMSSASLLAISSGVQGASSLGQGYAQMGAKVAQGDFEQRMAEMNARRADFLAEDAIKRGERDAAKVKKRGQQVIGAQRAAMAAQGIEVNDGSALAIQEDTAAMAAEDAVTVKNNAWREAWGFRVKAEDTRGAGRMARMSARREGRMSFLTGGMQAAGHFLNAAGQYQKGNE